MAGNYTRRINLYINGMQVRNDIKSITAEMTKLSRYTRTLNTRSREYHRNMARIRLLNGIITEHNAKLRMTQINLTTLKGLANAFNKYWPVVMGTVGAITGLVMGTRRAAEQFNEFDDKIADVMKVTDMTREEVIALNEELKKINTRTAQNDLLDLAYVAGKLGVRGQQDLLGFANAADKIAVALSKELGGNAEDAIRAIGKSVEIYDLEKVYGIEDAMLRVGSAVNALGMASTAQEGFLINFIERTAGIAPMAGVSIDKILGLAAALDRFGQKSEVSATAYSKLMSKMATETEAMAKILGMSIEDYLIAFTNDANETMLRLFETLKGAGEGNASFAELVKLLGESDLEGQRMTQVMGTMVNKVGEIREQMELAGRAMEENTSIINEFNIKNNTAAATVEKKQKRLQALRVELGEKLTPAYLHGLSIQEQFMITMSKLIQFIYENRRAIAALVTYLLVYRTALKSILAIKNLNIIATGYLKAALLRLSIAYNVLTGHIYRAAKAKLALRSLTLTNPWIMLSAAILGVVAAIAVFSTRISDAVKETLSLYQAYSELHAERSKAIQAEANELNLLFDQIFETNEGGALRNKLIQDLIDKYPELLRGLDNEKQKLDQIRQILAVLNREYQTRLRVAAYEAKAEAYKQKIIDNNVAMIEIEQHLAEMRSNPNQGYNQMLIVSLEKQYNYLAGLNEKYLKEIEFVGKKSEEVRSQGIKDEIALQQEILKTQKFARQLLQDQYNDAEKNPDANKALLAETKKVLALIDSKILTTETIITNLEQRLLGINSKITSGGGSGGKKETDYSEDAEIRARIAAKRKYQKGIIATEIDLQTELDKIALRFMQGRLSQMDKDAEKRAELQEKIVDKQIEIANDNQKRLDAIYESGVELSPVQREQLRFNNELKKLNIFHKQKKDFTTNEYLAYEALAKQHRQNLDKLDAAAIKEEFDRRQNDFDNNLSRLKLQHLSELDQVNSFEQAMAILRKTHTDEELKDIKTLNQAKLKIQDDQQNEEADMTIEHIAKLRTELQQLMETGVMDGVNLADNIMSQDEWDALQEILNALIEKLEKLKKVKKGDDEDDGPKKKNLTLKGKFRTDILGFTVDDWESLFKNLKEGEELTESLTMAAYALANAWSDVNGIISNAEDTWLQGYENKVNKRKKLLENQLEQGIINQEYYNYQVEKLDEDLEKKKAEIAIKQAKRDKAVAIFQATINTASAIAEALPNVALAAIAGIAGAMQIALIAGTPLPDAEGYEEGGFIDVQRAQDKKRFRARKNTRKRGWITEPTILAGEKPGSREYVIPDEAMDNPSIAPMIEMLEMARISHNLKTVDLSTAIPAMPGRQAGGFIYQETGNRKPETGNRKQQPGNSNQEPITQLYGAIATLNQILASGDIKTKIVYQDLRKMQEKVQAIEGNSFI